VVHVGNPQPDVMGKKFSMHFGFCNFGSLSSLLFGCMYNSVSFPLEPKLYDGKKKKKTNKISI
jgi:hypothetical protein